MSRLSYGDRNNYVHFRRKRKLYIFALLDPLASKSSIVVRTIARARPHDACFMPRATSLHECCRRCKSARQKSAVCLELMLALRAARLGSTARSDGQTGYAN